VEIALNLQGVAATAVAAVFAAGLDLVSVAPALSFAPEFAVAAIAGF